MSTSSARPAAQEHDPHPRGLNIRRAALYAGISIGHLRRLATAGRVKHTKIGRNFIFAVEVLDRLIDEGCDPVLNPVDKPAPKS